MGGVVVVVGKEGGERVSRIDEALIMFFFPLSFCRLGEGEGDTMGLGFFFFLRSSRMLLSLSHIKNLISTLFSFSFALYSTT